MCEKEGSESERKGEREHVCVCMYVCVCIGMWERKTEKESKYEEERQISETLFKRV